MNTVTKLALSNQKKNKTGSILLMVAICLTTILITAVSTIGNGILRMEKENAAESYGSNYGMFVGVNNTQLQEVKRRAEIAEVGVLCSAGIIKGNEKGSFFCAEEEVRNMFPFQKEYLLKEGSYPEGKNEIAGSEAFFGEMGLEHAKIGDTVSLPYRAGLQDAYSSQEFVISGILYDHADEAGGSSNVVFCSQAFYNSQFPENQRQYNVYFTLNDPVEVSMNNIEEVLLDIAGACGIDSRNLVVNTYYLMWILEPSYEVVVVCVILILGIVLFSIVVIYNIFQIGVVQKINEYGKIKALGATSRQMKQLIFREGMVLCVPAVPVGYVLGFLISKVSFAWLLQKSNQVLTGIETSEVPLFSITMLLGSVLLTLLAVLLALRKPMEIVARISPVEAIRYQENPGKKNHGIRKGKKKISVFSMAMADVMANKRRTIGTVLTMGVSCVLFVIISNCVGNIDTEYETRRGIMHGQFQLELSYSLNDEAYPENNLDSILKNNPFNETLVEDLKEIPSVTDVVTREVTVLDINGEKHSAAVVNREDFERMRWDGDLGEMDYDKAVKDKAVFYGWAAGLESDGYGVNAPIQFSLDNGTEKFQYQGKIAGSFLIADTYLVIPQEVYDAICPGGSSLGYIWVDCEEKDVPTVEQEIRNLLGDTSYVEMNTYHEEKATVQLASWMMTAGCYLFMAIVGMIGFMNLANTMIINITTKKQEYGVLQAVGMTNRQLNLMLQIQGLIFTLGTVCIALMVGLPLGYLLFVYAKQSAVFGMNVYHIPVVPILAMVIVVGVLQAVLSFLLSHNLKKESLVERIRYQG